MNSLLRFPSACGPLLAAAFLASALTAQRTWIVDERGGPGVDFTDIPPAIQVARTGDTILVHSGSGRYIMAASTIPGQAYRILGVRGPQGHLPVINSSGSLIIRGLGDQDVFVIQGFSGWLDVDIRSRGTVILDEIVPSLPLGGSLLSLLTSAPSSRIFVTGSHLISSLLGPACQLFTISDTTIGGSLFDQGVSGGLDEFAIVGSSITSRACALPPPTPPYAVTVAPGVSAWISGDSSLRFAPNSCGSTSASPLNDNSTTWVDTQIGSIANINPPLELCTITPRNAAAGTTATLDILAPSNQAVFIAASFRLTSNPVTLTPGFPKLWLDPTTIFPVAAVRTQGRSATYPIPIPAAVPRATVVWIQGASIAPGGQLRTSPVVPFVTR